MASSPDLITAELTEAIVQRCITAIGFRTDQAFTAVNREKIPQEDTLFVIPTESVLDPSGGTMHTYMVTFAYVIAVYLSRTNNDHTRKDAMAAAIKNALEARPPLITGAIHPLVRRVVYNNEDMDDLAQEDMMAVMMAFIVTKEVAHAGAASG